MDKVGKICLPQKQKTMLVLTLLLKRPSDFKEPYSTLFEIIFFFSGIGRNNIFF